MASSSTKDGRLTSRRTAVSGDSASCSRSACMHACANTRTKRKATRPCCEFTRTAAYQRQPARGYVVNDACCFARVAHMIPTWMRTRARAARGLWPHSGHNWFSQLTASVRPGACMLCHTTAGEHACMHARQRHGCSGMHGDAPTACPRAAPTCMHAKVPFEQRAVQSPRAPDHD
jgi:hypothetical protein